MIQTVRTHPETAVAVPFAAIVLAMLPAVLDQTILATALPVIAGDLGSLSDVSWVVTAYVVSAAASTPLWGKLGDRYGRKLLLEVALLAFVASSALCGAAQDITQLIVLRAIQGAAAGGLMTLAMAAVGDLVAPRERGRYQGYIAATFAVATIVGPLVGGVLVDHASWRWVFLVNLPIGVAALAGLHLRLPAPEAAGAERPLDVSGAALLAGATSALMLTCIWGGSRYAWDSATVLVLVAATVVLSGALLARERRAADPIVPFHLLRTGSVAIASATLFLGDRGAVLGHRLRAALPGDGDGGDADRGRAAAGAGHARDHRLDHAVRARDRPHGTLQALPDRRAGAHDGGARPARRLRERPVAGRHGHRAGHLRPGLRHGHAGADRRRPEQRRAP